MPHADPAIAQQRSSDWQKANPEKHRATAQRWAEANPEKVKEAQRRFDAKRVRDPEERRAYMAQWREKNREKLREINRNWEAANREKVRAAKRASRAKNPGYGAAYFATHLEARRQALFAGVKHRAKKEGLAFDLVYADIVWPETCPVLRIPINYEVKGGKRHPNSPSFDRTNPSQGYVFGNVVVMSWRANEIKRNATLDEVRMLHEYYVKVRSN